jgi:hypothetical protein
VARVACGGPRSVRAVCPVLRRVVSDGFSLSLSPGITLRAWSVEEECLFSNRFSGEYHPEDRAVNSGDAVLEIVLPHGGREDDEIAQAITSAVDLAKWALMAAESRDEWFIEGAIVVRSPSGWRGATIRREDTLRPVGYFMGGLGDEPAARAAALFQRASRLFETVPSLRNVVWFLGRALLANTARDSLLEAAIGLESLLVDGSGEVSYRFRLHGASVLSSLMKEDAFADLAEIYRLRSGAAHGDDRDRTEVQRLAPRCRYLLAQALVAVLDLVDSGELRPLANERKLSPAIGRLVRRRAIGLE